MFSFFLVRRVNLFTPYLFLYSSFRELWKTWNTRSLKNAVERNQGAKEGVLGHVSFCFSLFRVLLTFFIEIGCNVVVGGFGS